MIPLGLMALNKGFLISAAKSNIAFKPEVPKVDMPKTPTSTEAPRSAKAPQVDYDPNFDINTIVRNK